MQFGRLFSGRRECDVWKGLVAGAIGGLAASVVMNQFQALLSRLAGGSERSHGAQSMQQGAPHHGIARALQKQGRDDERDDSAMRLGNAISVGLFDRKLTQDEKHTAGTVLHYAYGISTGAAYGAAAEFLPSVTAGAGLPLGAVVWVGADEGVVPALGLSKAPTEYPLSVHAYAFASHLVYGLTTELVRRAVRQAL